MSSHFDAIVIGTGQGGAPLAAKLGQSGRKTAVIERHLFGGTCVNVGCTPTKTYVASARAAHVARHAASLGVVIEGTISVDLAKVKARKDEVIESSRNGVEKWLRDTPNITVFEGHGRFTGPHSVRVEGSDGKTHELSADAIYINTGTRAIVPDLEGIDQINWHTNSTILELTELPEHLVIIGGSYIALEFAQMIRRFGSRVTVLVRGERVLAREDKDVALQIQSVLAREGVKFMFSTQASRVEPDGQGVRIHAGDKTIDASHLLFATGRVPNTDDLGLEHAGIVPNRHGMIETDNQLRTNVPGIWALGDVKGAPAFTHISYNDFQIVYGNLVEGKDLSTDHRLVPYCVFTDPQLGGVGITEKKAREKGYKLKIGKYPMTSVSRAIERDETAGLMKLVIDAANDMILGASILACEGGELVQVLHTLMLAKQPYTLLKGAIYIHPTLVEGFFGLMASVKPAD